jgi:hypothetical protein
VWLVLGAALLLAAGGALLVPLLRAATAGEPETSSSVQLLACAEEVHDRYCQRLADDRAARGRLSTTDQDEAGRFAERLRAAFAGELGGQCRPEPGFCVLAEPPTAETLRDALAEAGFSAPVVRRTRLTDPAPLGTTVYGVRAGAACLVGWVDATTVSRPAAVGRHRDGSCLPA